MVRHRRLILPTLVAALAGLVFGFAGDSGGVERASAATACEATAVAQEGASSVGVLSTALTIDVSCTAPANLELRVPGGRGMRHRIEEGEPLHLENETAYLCHGQAATVDVAEVEGGWAESVPISGLNGIPTCDVLLQAGSTWIRWDGPRMPMREAFAGRALGWVNWERGEDGTVPGLTVWGFAAGDLLPRWGWGGGVPGQLAHLTHFTPGRQYLVQSTTERAWTFPRPPSLQSVFEDAQVVSFYGFPDVPAMGVLGHGTPAEVANEVALWAAHYDRLNGPREVIPAYHLITGVAQANPTRDGTWLARLDDEIIELYVEAAREREMLLFLDVQIGWSDPLEEVMLLERFLREPFVHMALDPEFATEYLGVRPGLAIGGITGADVNEVQHYLARLVREENLPPKILMVHQFAHRMLFDRELVVDVPEVEVSIDMDGFGTAALKLRHYDWFALTAPSKRPALKLFFDQDTPVMTPEQVQSIDEIPDLIMYQ